MSAHSPRLPKYRKHSSGQARVTLHGKDHMLGAYESAASKEAYRRIVAEWLETGGASPKAEAAPISVNELLLGYWKYATDYYGYGVDGDRKDSYCLRDAERVVKELYGRIPAAEFGLSALKACRNAMLAKDGLHT